LHQEEKVQWLEATVQLQEKVVLDQEALSSREKVVLHQTDQEQKVHQMKRKTLVTHKTKKTKKRLTFS
jgi:hypothetical protein